MKTIILHNPSKSNVTNYPISEAEIGYDGEVKYDDTGKYIETGKTMEWSLLAGETMEFPEYVGKYLKSIYEFLELKEGRTIQVEASTQSEAPAGGLICRGCGQTQKSPKGLALHLAHKHPELL